MRPACKADGQASVEVVAGALGVLLAGLVVRGDGGRVAVRVAVPLLLKRWRTPLRVGATASLEQR